MGCTTSIIIDRVSKVTGTKMFVSDVKPRTSDSRLLQEQAKDVIKFERQEGNHAANKRSNCTIKH